MNRRTQSFCLPDRDVESLRALAAERGESMSFILREALRAYLPQHLPGCDPSTYQEPAPRSRGR